MARGEISRRSKASAETESGEPPSNSPGKAPYSGRKRSIRAAQSRKPNGPRMSDEPIKIRITAEEVEQVVLPEPAPAMQQPPQPGAATKSYGRISSGPAGASAASSGGSLFMKAWFYLGVAGFAGAFTAWAVCEPFVTDGARQQNAAGMLLFPLMVILMSSGFGIAESAVERSAKKAIQKGILSIVLGTVLGVIFYIVCSITYNFLLAAFGVRSPQEPAWWLARGLAWAVFGIVGGIVYGVVDRAGKKCLYGVIGGVIGAGIGGLAFDPIYLALSAQSGALSRAAGMSILGASTGIAIGLVESALKDRWLYVSAGPLAGKQFILYKLQTLIGSQQSSDIYLFKDAAILPTHASIELRGRETILQSIGPVFISGQSAMRQQVLRTGDVIQIGRFTFSFLEKQKQR